MPKQSKTEQTDGSAAPTAHPYSNGEAIPEPKKRTRSAKAGAKKATGKKTGSKTPGKKTVTRRPAKKSKGYEPSDDDIRLRAYFIAEHRVQMSLAGDPAQDWLEARQQLIAENSASAAPKR